MKNLRLIIALSFILVIATASQTGDACETQDDCPSLHSCTDNICVHKKLFPITAREVIGTIIILVMNALLTAGGVGGGAAYVPYIMLLFEVVLTKSIAYAYVCVFGGGIGNMINAIFLKSPRTKRYLCNYDMNLVILPALMVGVMIGLILQRIFPPLVTNIILLIVLAYSMYKNYMKLKVTLKKEKHEKAQALTHHNVKAVEMAKQQPVEIQPTHTETALQAKEQEEAEIIPGIEEYDVEHEQDQAQAPKTEGDNDEELAKIKSEESNRNQAVMTHETPRETPKETGKLLALPTQEDPLTKRRHEIEQQELKFPWLKFALLFINIAIIIVVGIIRGTKKFSPVVGVDWSCGWDFLWFGLGIVFYSLAAVLNIYLVNKWQQEKVRVKYEFLPEEPLLDMRRIIILLIVSVAAGIVGAIVALGGALIIAPSLLDFGMPPVSAAATTGMFLIFSMFNAMFGAILNKGVTGAEIAWFLPLAILFSFVSAKAVMWYVKKTGKQSVILLILIAVIFLGFGCVIYNLINGMVENSHQQTTFTGVC